MMATLRYFCRSVGWALRVLLANYLLAHLGRPLLQQNSLSQHQHQLHYYLLPTQQGSFRPQVRLLTFEDHS